MMTVAVQPVQHLRIINPRVTPLPLAAPVAVHPAGQEAHLEFGKRYV